MKAYRYDDLTEAAKENAIECISDITDNALEYIRSNYIEFNRWGEPL